MWSSQSLHVHVERNLSGNLPLTDSGATRTVTQKVIGVIGALLLVGSEFSDAAARLPLRLNIPAFGQSENLELLFKAETAVTAEDGMQGIAA